MKKIKSDKGITLITLAVTIVVLMILTISVTASLSTVTEIKKYNNVKEDIIKLSEEVQRYYMNNSGEMPVTEQVPFDIDTKNGEDKNPNDNNIYYKIDITKLKTYITQKYGYNLSLNYESSTYLVNQQSLTVYFQEGVKLNNKMHYTVVDDNANGSFANSYYSKSNLPIISLVTFESSGDDKYYARTGDVLTLKMVKNYNFTVAPTITINGTSVTATWNNRIGVATYIVPENIALVEGNKIPFEISSCQADGRTQNAITTTTFGNSIIYDGTLTSYAKEPNKPKIEGTGLKAVILAYDGTASEVTDTNSKWYDYNTKQWANAVTKDSSGNITGYFVWIPRYEYKISGQTVTVQFIDTNKTTADTGYIIHPAFTNNVANGGWDSEISGFWVAKYPAGYQASTINSSGTLQNGSDIVVRSAINYSGIDNGFTSNPVDSSLGSSTKMSYPVFKPLTYAYNCIRIGDSYSLARDIQNASGFYGLSNIDSHMEKNSEWGAVAYLTQSNYGRNGIEVNINNYNMNNSNSKNTYCVTGLYGAGISDAAVTTIGSVNAYNTTIGVKGSSTGNITGVYDLNGCVWEKESSYITNGNSNLSIYGSSFTYITSDTTPQINGRSTKWATAYPYDSSSDSNTSNWTKYNSFKLATYGFGDAILETSISGSNATSWNGDYSYFPNASGPFFARGGSIYTESNSGVFCFGDIYGSAYSDQGFRVVLI